MSLDYVLYYNPLRHWIIALGIGVGVAMALAIGVRFFLNRLAVIAERTDNQIDDALLAIVGRTRSFFFVAVGVYVARVRLVIPDSGVAVPLRAVLQILMLAQAGLWITGVVNFITDRRLKRHQDMSDRVGVAAVRALGVAARVVAWTLLFVLALNWAFSLDVTALVTGLGISGIAVALAVQTVLGDVLAAISIVFDKPFDVGHDITADGVSGTVEEIGLKTTRLRSVNGELIIFSNANLLKARIHNYTRMQERRTVFTVELNATTRPDVAARVPSILESIVTAQPDVRFVRCHLAQLSGASLRYECVYMVLDRQLVKQMDVQQAINIELLRRFSAEKISVAQPVAALVQRPADPPP